MNSKNLAIVLILTMAISSLSLLMVESVNAQTIPKPSVPQFTLELIGPSFDKPPTYSLNPSTGLFEANDNGYHMEYSAVKIIIKNQPYVDDTFGIGFFYNVRWKEHSSTDWQELFSPDAYPSQDSGNQSTIISFALSGAESLHSSLRILSIPSGSQADFQVEALIGNSFRDQQLPLAPWVFTGEASGWSKTQTITIPETSTSTSPSPNSTPTPTVPEFSSLTIPLLLTITLVLAGLLVYHKKHKHNLVKKVLLLLVKSLVREVFYLQTNPNLKHGMYQGFLSTNCSYLSLLCIFDRIRQCSNYS